VERTLDILSPTDGYVMKRNVVDGQHVMEGSVMYEVAVLDPLWVLLEAYEEDFNWIRTGDSIQFTTRSDPSRTLQARVDYIDPAFDPASRTIRIRADIENRDRSLRPDMLVYGYLKSRHPEEKLTIPESALLWTGPRSLVYVKSRNDDGHPLFEAREVTAGARAGDRRIIEEGLSEGEEVVVNGAFRVDSEFQLSGRFSMMNREPGRTAVRPHDHGLSDAERPDSQSDTIAESEPAAQLEGVSDSFRTEVSGLVNRYLLLKNALFDSNAEQASKEAGTVKAHLVSIGEHRLDGDAHIAWMQSYSALMEPLQAMSETVEMEVLRETFRLLSSHLIEAVERFGIKGVVYHQYCPMEQADWLSNESEIRNPYDPERMPSCGEVIKRIEF
jgi:membrane fusion protein, copper/silver efflux system